MLGASKSEPTAELTPTSPSLTMVAARTLCSNMKRKCRLLLPTHNVEENSGKKEKKKVMVSLFEW